MGGNYDCSVLRDISCSLLGTMLDDEAAETTQVNILLIVEKALLDCLRKCLNCGGNILAGYTCRTHDLVDYICFCHFF